MGAMDKIFLGVMLSTGVFEIPAMYKLYSGQPPSEAFPLLPSTASADINTLVLFMSFVLFSSRLLSALYSSNKALVFLTFLIHFAETCYMVPRFLAIANPSLELQAALPAVAALPVLLAVQLLFGGSKKKTVPSGRK